MNGSNFLLISSTTLALTAILFFHGCASSPPPTEVNRFTFVYNNLAYDILSTDAIRGVPVNYLLLREGNTFLLRARDNDLDGVLDTLLAGDFSLEEANVIYAFGIAQAFAENKFKRREPPRVFYKRTVDGYYAIQSYEAAPNDWYIRFIIFNTRNNSEIAIIDVHADGILDHVEKGDGDPEASQPLYEEILEAGIRAGQITSLQGVFVVRSAA